MFIAPPTVSNVDQNYDSSADSRNVMHNDVITESLQDMHESTDVTLLFNKTYQIMEKLSATHIGQYLLKRGDLVLRTFEETAKWRLSADNPDYYLLRPLPWIPFLILIVVLRLFLIYLSIGALLLGDEPVTVKKFIYFIQTRRRKLRSIRMHGLKVIQEREEKYKPKNVQNVGDQPNRLMTKLSNFFNTFACRPSSHNDEVKAIAITRDSDVEDEAQSNTRLAVPTARTPANSKSPGLDASPLLSCTEMLNKFANQDSDEDSDYVPANEDEESVNDESYTSVSSNNTSVNNIDTSDENAKDLSLTEKDQTKATKSPKRSILLPVFEFKTIDANKTFITDLKNTDDDHDNNMETISGDNIKTSTISPKTPLAPMDNGATNNMETISGDNMKTPLAPMDNGATNNGGLAAAVEVVQVQEVAKPQNALFVNLLNGHAEVQKKSTPGHETAAHSKPHLPPPLLGNIANANPTTVGMLVDAIADCFGNLNEFPANKPTNKPATMSNPLPKPLSLYSSSSCSITSSNSSLSSFMTSDDLPVDVEGRSDPPTPTPSLSATSSTEDIYQSPYGSPPDFSRFNNAMKNPFLAAINAEASPNGNNSVDVEEVYSESKHFKPNAPEPKSQNSKQQQQKYQQRYRNRNRR